MFLPCGENHFRPAEMMSMADVSDENLTVSPAFVQQVRDLLEHLYDFVYLQKQTLVLPASQTGCLGRTVKIVR